MDRHRFIDILNPTNQNINGDYTVETLHDIMFYMHAV